MEIAEIVKVGVASSFPAYAVIQVVKIALASRLEHRFGRQRWNAALRVGSGAVGAVVGVALAGWPWGAVAGTGGGLAATAVFAVLLRTIRAWAPPAAPPPSAPPSSEDPS
jgi:uncharacterized PurR-regulated membrane protein YhhQ (DUF165 family)